MSLTIHCYFLFLWSGIQGGKSGRVVDCVLAMKSYGEWKQMGGNGSWKYGGNLKPLVSVKPFFRKNSEPFKNSLSRSQSMNDSDGLSAEHNLCGDVVSVESNEMVSELDTSKHSPISFGIFCLTFLHILCPVGYFASSQNAR